MILIDAEHLTAARPNRPLFTDVSLTVATGDRIGVVGINGSGKSTLLSMLARTITPDRAPIDGEVRWGRGARIGVLDQHAPLTGPTVADAVGHGWQGEAMLDRVGMTAMRSAPVDQLSGGQAKRVALARLLAGEHDALILDEPTNHLDLDAIAFLEQWLAAFRGGLVMVTHDRHVLDRVTTKVLELDRGRAHLHVPAGRHAGSGYAAYLAGRAAREEQAETAEQVRRNLARTELAWLRRGAPARSTKPKARVASATALVQARPEPAARSGELTMAMGSQRLGSKGVELRDVSFAWPEPRDGEGDVLCRVSMMLEPGDRIGIVGANGAGKSTLLELIAGRLSPTVGEVERGTTVRIGYYDQLGRELDLDRRVREVVAGDKGEPSLADVALMRRFWFDGDAQFAPVATLSGGERRRLQLLLTLVEQPNVLLLDEPTNDLDLDTIRALEDLLDDWAGIVVVVSHDRAFVDRTVDELYALDGRGGLREVRGGIAGWLAERESAGPERATATGGAATVAPGPGGRPAPRPTAPSPAGPVRAPAAPPGPMRSPSTLRRLLSQAERLVAQATERRDGALARLANAAEHREIASIGDELSAAQEALEAAEAEWLALAGEAEERGLGL